MLLAVAVQTRTTSLRNPDGSFGEGGYSAGREYIWALLRSLGLLRGPTRAFGWAHRTRGDIRDCQPFPGASGRIQYDVGVFLYIVCVIIQRRVRCFDLSDSIRRDLNP